MVAAVSTAPRPDFSFEDQESRGDNALPVCGIDEVGRGPLAGPVVAAAVILHRDIRHAPLWAEINDSKKLSAPRRADLYARIHDAADVAIALCSVLEIDQINILQASLRAMQKACNGLPLPPAAALIDGNKAPKLACATRTIVKGDARSLSIAAASIVAKHYRDALMKKLAEEFPPYGWAKNAGYGTAQHLKALEIHGVTPHHRLSFAPVSKLIHKDSSVIN
ncbi:MAG: ribonuclease HII [Alphaproteobacteria bacterium]|nr:ribonuclease HII [Alphaproteobacteria bacterium]